MITKTRRFWVIAVLLLACGCAGVLWLQGQYIVPVVMYHGIGTGEAASDLNSVSAENFNQQMDFLRDRGYNVLTVQEYVDGVIAGRKFPHNSVVITFDDGHKDNYTAGYPILKAHGFPAAIFVPTNKMGAEGWLTWPEIREMAANNITFGSHTLDHMYLPDKPHDEIVKQLVESKRDLEAQLGQRVDYLAYPIGGFSEDVKAVAKAAGYKAAFTTNRGFDRTNTDLFELKRIRIKNTDGPWQVWWKLTGYYNLIRKSKNPY